MSGPVTPAPGEAVDAGWLAARRDADATARAVTVDQLLPPLIEHLRRRTIDRLQVVDLGAGRGANQRWLRPRLPFPQHWTHLDYDSDILEGDRLPETTYVCGPVEALPHVLAQLPPGPVLVTCSALLDVLRRGTLSALAAHLVQAQVPALLSLSVTGSLSLDPSDPDDAPLLAAFNDHQRRDGRAGPDAPQLFVAPVLAAGIPIQVVDTPWQLAPRDNSPFVDRFLQERVAAAVEQQPELADRGARWLARRRAELREGRLRLLVGHRDVLLLPT